MNPLESHIRRLIGRHGPITVAEYMALCLGHPDYGYYQTRDPFGRGGDFITAPEISQMFGEMIAVWCLSCWDAMGRGRVMLVEFGPGRGTLMADLLRVAAKVRPDFVAAASLHLVETSPVLRQKQAEAVGAYHPLWHEDIAELPEGPAFYIMNEFFDALPIRQFVATEQGLCERCVGIDAETDRLCFVVDRAVKIKDYPLSLQGRGEVGQIHETCPAAVAITQELSRRIVAHGGAALVIDYGYTGTAGSDTLQAVCNHGYADPLESPGEADLTAHVDFEALAVAAQREGAIVQGPAGQGDFLRQLGIEERAKTLGGDAMTALHRLTNADQMGQLFKVLMLTR